MLLLTLHKLAGHSIRLEDVLQRLTLLLRRRLSV